MLRIYFLALVSGAFSALAVAGDGLSEAVRVPAMGTAVIQLSRPAHFVDNGFLPGRGTPADPFDPEANVISELVGKLRGEYLKISDLDLGVLEEPGKPPSRRSGRCGKVEHSFGPDCGLRPRLELLSKHKATAMRFHRFFHKTHKWTGVLLSVFFLNLAVTGFFLLVKKNYAWIQPPTQVGVEGGPEDFISCEKLFQVVLSRKHDDFQRLEDIDRVDFRPGKRVFKVRSRQNYAEMQIDAVSGAVLSVAWRPSDMLETLHDGSFFGVWFHGYAMPLAAATLFFLTVSGLYLWLAPLLRKRRRRVEGPAAQLKE